MDKTSWTYDNKMVANIFSKNVDNELMRKNRYGHVKLTRTLHDVKITAPGGRRLPLLSFLRAV